MIWPFKRDKSAGEKQEPQESVYLSSENFRGESVPNLHLLEALGLHEPPSIEDRVEGIASLYALGHFSLQGGVNNFVFYFAEEGEAIPAVFLVKDTVTTLGFDWPILWYTQSVHPLPDFAMQEGRIFTVIKGTAAILTDNNQNEWLDLIGNATCFSNTSILGSNEG